jgi:hypothetical protein
MKPSLEESRVLLETSQSVKPKSSWNSSTKRYCIIGVVISVAFIAVLATAVAVVRSKSPSRQNRLLAALQERPPEEIAEYVLTTLPLVYG